MAITAPAMSTGGMRSASAVVVGANEAKGSARTSMRGAADGADGGGPTACDEGMMPGVEKGSMPGAKLAERGSIACAAA